MARKNGYWASKPSDETIEALQKYMDLSVNDNYLNILERNNKYYYNFNTYDDSYTSLNSTGDSGEFVQVACNQARSLIRNLVTLVSSDRISFECIAMSSDEGTFASTRVASAIIEDVISRKNIDKLQDEAVELSLVLGSSFYLARWNTALGEPYISDSKGKTLFNGDIEIQVKSPSEVTFDLDARSWEEVDWVLVRQRMNKYTIASQYKKFASELEDIVETMFEEEDGTNSITKNEDMITVYEFYHKPTPAMPNGRLMVFVNDEIILFDKDNPYGCIPIVPVIPMNRGRCLRGYALYSDLLPLQEMLDNDISAISSNHAAFGIQNILMPRSADIDVEDLSGMRLINYNDEEGSKPEALNLAQSAPELFRMIDVYKQNMMEISGINGAVRGAPPAGVTSGTAIATLSANALTFASPYSKASQIGLEKLMELAVKLFKTFATTDRTLAILGANGSYINMRFNAETIEDISHIKIRPRNPLADTMAGRAEIGQQLLNSGLIKQPSDYLRFLQTGEIEELGDEVTSENDLIGAENEQMRMGNVVQALALDNHNAHLVHHKTLLNNPIIRQNAENVSIILEHIQQHLDLLRDTDPMMLEIAMGDGVSPEIVQASKQPAGQMPPPQPMATMGQAAQPTENIAEPLPLTTPLNPQGV